MDPVPLSTLSLFFVWFRLFVQFNLLETKGNAQSCGKSVSLLSCGTYHFQRPDLICETPGSDPANPPSTKIPCSREKSSSLIETSIVKLQAHTEKGTFPRDLRYVAKANLNIIKREAQRKFIRALTKFHYRRVECNNGKLQRAKSDKCRSKRDTSTSFPGSLWQGRQRRETLGTRSHAQLNSSTKLMFYTLLSLEWKRYIDDIRYSRCGMLTKKR